MSEAVCASRLCGVVDGHKLYSTWLHALLVPQHGRHTVVSLKIQSARLRPGRPFQLPGLPLTQPGCPRTITGMVKNQQSPASPLCSPARGRSCPHGTRVASRGRTRTKSQSDFSGHLSALRSGGHLPTWTSLLPLGLHGSRCISARLLHRTGPMFQEKAALSASGHEPAAVLPVLPRQRRAASGDVRCSRGVLLL